MFEKRKNNDNTNLDRLTNKSDLNVTRQGNQRCYPSQWQGSFLDGRDREPATTLCRGHKNRLYDSNLRTSESGAGGPPQIQGYPGPWNPVLKRLKKKNQTKQTKTNKKLSVFTWMCGCVQSWHFHSLLIQSETNGLNPQVLVLVLLCLHTVGKHFYHWGITSPEPQLWLL